MEFLRRGRGGRGTVRTGGDLRQQGDSLERQIADRKAAAAAMAAEHRIPFFGGVPW